MRLTRVKWDTVRKRYQARMERAMNCLAVDLRENLPASNPSNVWTMDADMFWVIVTCEPEGQERFDVSFRIEDAQDYEGEPLGYTFSIDIVEEGGRILGGCSPYNYTERVWCRTLAEIDERFRMLEESVDTVCAYIADKVLVTV